MAMYSGPEVRIARPSTASHVLSVEREPGRRPTGSAFHKRTSDSLMLTSDTWAATQRNCDECLDCRANPRLVTTGVSPARPWWPERQGRIVLVSEAPPMSGGFWNTGVYDDLRDNLFCILQGLGLRLPNDFHADTAIRVFLQHDLFLLQTVKWPLAREKHRRSFNHFSRTDQDTLVTHTRADHLGPELQLLAPRAVLAMGTAAWQACATYVPGQGRDARLGEVRGRSFEAIIDNRAVPLDVTSLPVGQNMRRVEEAALIRTEIATFMRRVTHGLIGGVTSQP
jgi:uracil-DNA glycosylase